MVTKSPKLRNQKLPKSQPPRNQPRSPRLKRQPKSPLPRKPKQLTRVPILTNRPFSRPPYLSTRVTNPNYSSREVYASGYYEHVQHIHSYLFILFIFIYFLCYPRTFLQLHATFFITHRLGIKNITLGL